MFCFVMQDTAHTFAAGYDLRSPVAYAETMSKLDSIVGLKYVLAFHVNDSKAEYALSLCSYLHN